MVCLLRAFPLPLQRETRTQTTPSYAGCGFHFNPQPGFPKQTVTEEPYFDGGDMLQVVEPWVVRLLAPV